MTETIEELKKLGWEVKNKSPIYNFVVLHKEAGEITDCYRHVDVLVFKSEENSLYFVEVFPEIWKNGKLLVVDYNSEKLIEENMLKSSLLKINDEFFRETA